MRSRKQRLHSAELRRLDNIAATLDRIATAIEKRPTMEIGRIDVGIIKNSIDKSQSSISGDHGASATGAAIATIASDISKSLNTNANNS